MDVAVAVRSDAGEPDHRALPLVLKRHLTGGDAVAATGTVEDRTDGGPLVLEGVAGRQPQIDFECPYVRGISRNSKVSMMSPSRRSWKSDSTIPHSKPAATSRTSSLTRRSDGSVPLQMIRPSRR